MQDNNVKIFVSVLGILIIGIIIAVFLRSSPSVSGPGKYDEFAKCLGDKGAVFYGAFWCPHCQAQKKLFGSSAKLLPYVECSTADSKGQLQVCKDANIPSYPTWKLNGEVIPNENTAGITLETLSTKVGCPLPVATQ